MSLARMWSKAVGVIEGIFLSRYVQTNSLYMIPSKGYLLNESVKPILSNQNRQTNTFKPTPSNQFWLFRDCKGITSVSNRLAVS